MSMYWNETKVFVYGVITGVCAATVPLLIYKLIELI